MSEESNDTSELSIAVDRALLKLSRDYGISIPKDDYILIQVYLNKAIIESTFSDSLEKLSIENKNSKDFFRHALIRITKTHNETIEKTLEETNKKHNEAKSKMEKILWFCLAATFVNILAISILILNGI